jgi:hypothetical protein
LKDNTDIRDKLEHALRKKLGLAAPPEASGQPAAAANPQPHGEKAMAAAASAAGVKKPAR